MEKLSCSFWDARGVPHRAVALWEQNVGVLFDIKFRGAPEDVSCARGGAYVLGDLLLGVTKTEAQSFDRSRYRTARDGLTHYLLQFYPEGRCGPRDGSSGDWTRPGDLLVIDLAQPLASAATDFSNLNLLVPRRLLAPLLNRPNDQHLRIIRWEEPLVRLFHRHLAGLYGSGPDLTKAHIPQLTQPTLALAAAAINGVTNDRTRDGVALGLLEQICRYAEQNLTDANLTAETVARRFGISRRKLYYLFQELGGFVHYIRERRLQAVRLALVDPGHSSETIAEIAESYGFHHRSGLISAFRTLYGVTPGEIRKLAKEMAPMAPLIPQAEWRALISSLR